MEWTKTDENRKDHREADMTERSREDPQPAAAR